MDGIPADFMSLFPMPEKWKGNWIGEGAILWQGNQDRRKMHLGEMEHSHK